MRQKAGSSSATVLRECLAGPWPLLRVHARRIIRRAIETTPTIAAACRKLDIPRQSFERLRADFPEIERAHESNNGHDWTEVTGRVIGEWCVIYRTIGADGVQVERIEGLAPCKEAAIWAAASRDLELSDNDMGWHSVRQLDYADHAE